MPRITIGTIIKILLASLCVGLLLAYFNLSPQELFRGAFEHFSEIFEWVSSVAGWAVSYVLLGAIVVVPIWLLVYLIDALKKKK